MPELPEVETYKNRLKEKIINKNINDIRVYWDNIIKFPSKEIFVNKIKGQSFKDITRRGKYLIMELNDYYLIVHLRMEGKFFIKNSDEPLIKHEHVVFYLNDGTELRYHDTRKFGKMYLIDKDKLYSSKPLNELGLEPFDEYLTVKYLKNKLLKRKLPIKTVLLNQSIISGIGNIYADEILFLSKMNPYKKANELNDIELNNIIKNTREVLNKAIKAGGTTIRTYMALNRKGTFQSELYVYGRDKQKCLKCESIILKDTIGGRGTYYCPKCQKVHKKG